MNLEIFSPAGVVPQAAPLRLAAQRLKGLGFEVQLQANALKKHQRFAGPDALRVSSLHEVARRAPSIAMASRGGYGLTRLLDGLDWKLLARSIEQGTRWVGYSDCTALQLGLLAHCGEQTGRTWAGPMALDDFGRAEDAGGLDDVTVSCFTEAMHGELEAVGWRTEEGFDGLGARGTLWGGNLAMVCSLLGTPHWPTIKGGVLFLEDVNEQPFRVERMLLQLHQAGVLKAQKAVLLGQFTWPKKSPLDRGFGMKALVAQLRSVTKTPILTGLPFGHVPTKLTLPIGRRVQLLVQGRDALLGW
jgi:muramoyltetrapeptide carboxypeptidase